MQAIRLVSRDNTLSKIHAKEVKQIFFSLNIDLSTSLNTKNTNRRISLLDENILLAENKVIEDAVMNDEADVFVELAKDLPYPLPDDLDIFALLSIGDESDSLVSRSNCTLLTLPYGARVGIESLHLKNKILQKRSDFKVIMVQCAVEENIALIDNDKLDAIVVATYKLKSLSLENRIAEELPFKTHPLQGHLAVVGKKGNIELKKQLEEKDIRKKWGKVVLAGFGPGDKWLITKKAEYNLHRAEVIFYDDLVDEKYLNQFCAKKIYVGKRKGKHKFDQNEINELMYRTAKKGKWVVRIKGGDPLIFGRGAEEYHYLQSRLLDAEIIPGITSAFAAAANSIIPLTERSLSSSVAFLSGHDLNKLKIPKVDTLVFYMGASNQQELASKIIAEGWHENTPVGVVYNASNLDHKIYRGSLKELKINGSGLLSPSIIIVGKTAQKYNEQQKKWLYTGISVDDFKMDAHVVHTPLISIKNIEMNDEIRYEMENLKFYHRIIFTSRYSVHHFFKKLFELGKDVRSLSHLSIDSIGKTTSQALREYGLIITPLSVSESSDGMVEFYKQNNVSGESVFIPRSNQGTSILPDGLKALGNKVCAINVYHTHMNKTIIKQDLDQFNGVVFTSPSTVNVFVEVYNEIPSHLKIKCRGLQTEKILQMALRKDYSDVGMNVI